jgi:hypothetical protein
VRAFHLPDARSAPEPAVTVADWSVGESTIIRDLALPCKIGAPAAECNGRVAY